MQGVITMQGRTEAIGRAFLTGFMALAALGGCALSPQARTGLIDVTVLAINDFHGNVETPPGDLVIRDPASPGGAIRLKAGGSETMATLVKTERAAHRNSVFVAAGDLIGASPLFSAAFHDEPTVEALSLMGLEASAVGNHEFDEGRAELLRMQSGGCHPVDGCKSGHEFKGAGFHYLAASTIDIATGRPILPPYFIKRFEGVPVAFIGLTLKGTPDLSAPSAVAGLKFEDEADTVNALVPELKAEGVEAIIVLIHQGGYPSGDYNECPGITGPIVDIVKHFDTAVDVVVSGHTHKPYVCEIDGRLVTSGDKFGSMVTEISLKLDRRTRDVVEAKANNLIVRVGAYAKDADQIRLIAEYQASIAPIAGRVVGRLEETLVEASGPSGDSPLGNIVADAAMAAAQTMAGGARFAVTNHGGVRSDLVKRDDGAITYSDIFAVQPFGNVIVTADLTGAEIYTLLEQQWLNQRIPKILHISKELAYVWDNAKPPGERIVAGSLTLNGAPIDPAATYRVAMNNFIAEGGDGFVALKSARNKLTGVSDVEALEAFVADHSPLEANSADRITRLN
jgi:5'-nucleotidase